MSVDTTTGFPPIHLIDGVVTTDTVFNLPQGNYTLTLADSIGCISDDYNVNILQPDSLYAWYGYQQSSSFIGFVYDVF